jgi:5-(hydroxymethyl)furfural/furfural oxidase
MEAPTVKACTRFWFLSGYSDEVRALAVRRATNWFKTGVAALLLEVGGPPRKILYRRRLANGFDVHAAIRDDEVLADWVRAHVWPGWHPSGTCRMGPDHDPMAVLDPECRVRQVDGLRVVDASVMPTIPRGNTNIPTIMIAEKVADAILGTLTAPDLPTEQVA